MTFKELFPNRKPIIACIHLQPLPGSPGYSGNLGKVTDHAVEEARLFMTYGADAVIVENFRDFPFIPGPLPAETIAAMAVIAREVKRMFGGPVGVNALRNDAHGALAIALAAGAAFIRVNIHTGAALTDQGIIEGKAHETMRLRRNLCPEVLVLADIRVKHAAPLAPRPLEEEVKETLGRGMADGLIVTGTSTGKAADTRELRKVKEAATGPVLIGSGTTPENLPSFYGDADGFIVGSWFKINGVAGNEVDEKRVKQFLETYRQFAENP